MGYGFYYIRSGGVKRPAGYMVIAECDQYGCHEEINRGMGYVCGSEPHDLWDDAPGCGRYYCGKHLTGVGRRGGCRHSRKASPRRLGQVISDMVPNADGSVVCLDILGHAGRHAWAAA